MKTNISSILSNIAALSDTALAATSDAQCPRDADYRSISLVSNVEYLLFSRPLKLYALNLMLQDMQKLFSAHINATPTEAQRLLEECGLEVSPVCDQLRRSIGFGARDAAAQAQVQSAAQKLYASVETQLNAKLDGIFRSKGPYYLTNLTLRMSEALSDPKLGAIPAASRAMAEATRPKDRLACEYTVKLLQNVQRRLLHLNNSVYNVYTSVLDELSEEVRRQSGILSGGTRDTNASGQTYIWTVGAATGTSNALQEYLDDCFPQQTIHRLRETFVSDLLNHRREWCDLEHSQAVERIRTFIRDQITKLCSAGPEDVFTKAFRGKNAVATVAGPNQTLTPTADLKAAVTAFLKEVNTQLAPMANVDSAIGSIDRFPDVKVLLIPRNCPHLYSEVCAQATGFQVELSDVEDMIVGYRVVMGVPPHGLKTVYQSEEAYEANINKVGLHLSESFTCDLRDLPNPIPVSCYNLGGHSVVNPREMGIAETCGKMFRRAKELGLAKPAAGSGHTIYELALPDDPEALAAVLSDMLSTGAMPASIPALMESAGLSSRTVRLTTGAYLLDAPEANEPDYYDRQAIRVLRLMPALHRPLRLTLAAYSTLAAKKAAHAARRQHEQAFLNYIAAGLITWPEDNGSWTYLDTRGDQARLFVPDPLNKVERSCPLYYALEAFRTLPEAETQSLAQRFAALDRRNETVMADIAFRLRKFKNHFFSQRIDPKAGEDGLLAMGSTDFLQDVQDYTGRDLGGELRDTYDRLLKMV